MTEEILASVALVEDDSVRAVAFGSVEELVYQTGDNKSKTAYLLPFLQDPNFEIQVQAAVLLSRIDNKITNGVPILLAAASKTNLLAQAIAARISTGIPPVIRTSVVTHLVRFRQGAAREGLQRMSPKRADRDVSERSDPDASAAQAP
jgi:hypothetical protein